MGKKNTKKNKGNKKQTVETARILHVTPGANEVVYLLSIVAEPQEPPIGISQPDFDLLLDYGSRLPERATSKDEELVDFATLTPVEGKKFYWREEQVKRKTVLDFFGRALSTLIHDAVERVKHEVAEQTLDSTGVTGNETSSDDPLIQYVADQLFADWFPEGHGGDEEEGLREDRKSWREAALKDAQVAVEAVRSFPQQ